MGDFYELFSEDARIAAAAPRPGSHQPRQKRKRRPHGRLPVPSARKLLGQARFARLARGHLRTGRRPAPSQRFSEARSHPPSSPPGTLTDEALLDPRECNYLAAVITQSNAAAQNGAASHGQNHAATPKNDLVGLAWVELVHRSLSSRRLTSRCTGRPTRLHQSRRMLDRRTIGALCRPRFIPFTGKPTTPHSSPNSVPRRTINHRLSTKPLAKKSCIPVVPPGLFHFPPARITRQAIWHRHARRFWLRYPARYPRPPRRRCNSRLLGRNAKIISPRICFACRATKPAIRWKSIKPAAAV